MNTVYARHIWWLVLAMAALAVASFALTGLHIDPFSKPALLAPFGLLAAIWWFYRNVRPDPRLRTLAECFAQILLLLLFGTLLSYAAAAAPIPAPRPSRPPHAWKRPWLPCTIVHESVTVPAGHGQGGQVASWQASLQASLATRS